MTSPLTELPEALEGVCGEFPHPLVFATLSGTHLYGFASPDSDYDVRGCHTLPTEAVVGLEDPNETEERIAVEGGIEIDLVSHDLRKFCRLLLRRNGYVLEQLLSPHIVQTSSTHDELKSLAPRIATRHHAHHYLGFARSQWRMFEQEPTVRAVLYVYRVLLTGIYLMESGEIQAHLPTLLEEYPQSSVAELIAAKTSGAEKMSLPGADVHHHATSFQRLLGYLEEARDRSSLPATSNAQAELNDLLVRSRIGER